MMSKKSKQPSLRLNSEGVSCARGGGSRSFSCIKLFTGKCTGLRYWLASIESTGSPSGLTKQPQIEGILNIYPGNHFASCGNANITCTLIYSSELETEFTILSSFLTFSGNYFKCQPILLKLLPNLNFYRHSAKTEFTRYNLIQLKGKPLKCQRTIKTYILLLLANEMFAHMSLCISVILCCNIIAAHCRRAAFSRVLKATGMSDHWNKSGSGHPRSAHPLPSLHVNNSTQFTVVLVYRIRTRT